MDYNYLIETKNEFLNAVIGILTPQIYNGLITMYDHSLNVFTHLKKKIETNPKNISSQIVNYFKLKTNDFSKMTVDEVENEYQKIKIEIFKKYVNDIASKNNMEIEGEYLRIKNESRFSDIFDSLIKACFKSYLLFFTFDPKTKNSNFNSEKYYENINIRDFIHKCYVETCTFFQNNPELFIKRNKKAEINEHIKTCLIMSIRKSLPYNDMINEYLRIDFDMKQDKIEEFKKMEQLINNIMEKNKSKYIIDKKEYDIENNYNNYQKTKINKIINENKNKTIIQPELSMSDENIEVIKNYNNINNNKFLEEETSIDIYDNIYDNKNEKTNVKINNNIKENFLEEKSSIDIYNTKNNKVDEKNTMSEKSNIKIKNNEKDDSDNEKDDSDNEKDDSDNETNDDETSSDNNSMETSSVDLNIVGNDINSNNDEIKKSLSIITSLGSIPKRKNRISKIKNTIDKNMENFYNDLII